MRRVAALFLVGAAAVVAVWTAAGSAARAGEPGLVLEEGAYWRQYLRFGTNRISPAAMAAEGEKLLGGVKVRREANGAPKVYRGPYTAPAPAEGWAAEDFDDSSWVLERHTFQGDIAPDSKDFLDRGLVEGFYRTRFVLNDPDKAGKVTLSIVFRGGVRAFVNGTEVTRGGLPEGALAEGTPGKDYPLQAYQQPTAAG